MEAKKRKVKSTDWDRVETHVKNVYESRKTSSFRKEHERIWKEVDRQIMMKPLERVTADGKKAPKSWHNAIELGELSKASEIITSDVMRIIFPQDRMWFQPHTELQWPLGDDGQPQIEPNKQSIQDGLLRNLMAQQHKDFGFKARFRLSVKESLHHGSFVAEVRFDKQLMVRNGDQVKTIGAPVWTPYSMWNAYPDPSPSVIGTNLYYTGSMVLVEYMPFHKLKEMSGEGWMPERLKKVEKRNNTKNGDDSEDVELIKFKGDITIERGDGDIYLPNSEVILANDKLVYYSEAELPYPNVIFAGYERQDIRDPYYTSPIIKQSPIHRMTTIVANQFLNAVALKVEPPIEYDANDPDYVMNDGPTIAPGAKTATRSMGKGFTALDIGEPRFALDAYAMGIKQMQEGLGVSSQRSGVRDADRETATSANLANQGAEVRTMEFVSQLEPQALLPFLYMQHEYNRMKMDEYTFYNDQMDTPDFIRAKREQLQEDVHFEVVGSRGILGEEKRDRKIAETTAFFSGNPLFAPKMNVTPIMLEMYKDAGKKNPEEWVKKDEGPQIPPQVQQKFQELQQALQQAEEENKQLKSKQNIEMAKLQADMQQFVKEQAQEREQFNKDYQLRVAEFKLAASEQNHTQNQDRVQSVVSINAGDEIGKVAQNLQSLAINQSDTMNKAAEMIEKAIQTIDKSAQTIDKTVQNIAKTEAEKEKPRKKIKVKRTAEGYEVE